jgi:predicted GNAT family acetyltransferase
MAVVQNGLVGIFNVITNPSQRGRGFAGRLTQTLLASGYQNGATGAYLQVGTDNKAALVVYARLGFVERYSYHYRRPA